ncbi:MAG: methyltransferase domain-containing protein [Theionarchaea archaeon]|nr:methyltransferase domain-containing protein [Theionarchaea archaeon]
MSKQDIHTPERWAEILKKQAEFTKKYRYNLYEKVSIQNKKNILDVGCGTGAVTEDIISLSEGYVTGIDIDIKKLEYAKSLISDRVAFLKADVLDLPFPDNTFDLVTFCIVLTHITEQQNAVNEMVRVTQKGGIVLATLEPDYEGSFSYPENRADHVFRKFFEDNEIERYTGRKLRYFFVKAGLKTEIGLYTDILDHQNEEKDIEKEIENYLKNFERSAQLLSDYGWTTEEIEEYKLENIELIKKDLAFSFCPCFYAIGRK